MAQKQQSWFDRLLLACGIFLVTQYMRLLHLTGRIEFIDEHYPKEYWDKGEPFIGTLWHGRFIMMPFAWRSETRIGAIISKHGDGEFISRVLTNFNFISVRGSSNATKKKRKDRGGAEAFRAMVRALRDGTSMGITLDGPKGPRMRVKDGAVMLARMTGRPILPVAFSAKRGMYLGTWDSFLLAWPFSRAVFKWGAPIYVPRDADPALMEAKRLELETTLNTLTDELDEMMGRTKVEPGPAEVRTVDDQSAPSAQDKTSAHANPAA